MKPSSFIPKNPPLHVLNMNKLFALNWEHNKKTHYKFSDSSGNLRAAG